ncbi:hypothetical protein AJ87_08925 [Rhizobium yanglingense]|nr:hypothetical protein AJ87_08925 [Rhizobium yanglingense]
MKLTAIVRALLTREEFKIYPGSLCGENLPADDRNFPFQATMSGLNSKGPARLEDAKEIIGLLLDRDPAYGQIDCGEWTAARMAGQNAGMLKFLDERHADLGFDWHSTALVEAILSKNADAIDYLLQNDDAVCNSARGSFDSYSYYATGDDDNAANATLVRAFEKPQSSHAFVTLSAIAKRVFPIEARRPSCRLKRQAAEDAGCCFHD